MLLKKKRQNKSPKFNPKKYIAVDTETTGLSLWRDEPFMVGLSDEEGNTLIVEFSVDGYFRKVLPDYAGLQVLREYISNTRYVKVFHHAKFDARMLAMVGIILQGQLEDTLISSRVCNNIENAYRLKYLAWKYCGIDDSDEKELKEAVDKARRLARVMNSHAQANGKPLLLLGENAAEDYWLPKYLDGESRVCEKYCRLDVQRTMVLWLMYKDIMENDPILYNTYKKEMELWPIINKMEERGLKIDPAILEEETEKVGGDLVIHLAACNKYIIDHKLQPFPPEKTQPKIGKSGKSLKFEMPEFNPASPQQLTRILYEPKPVGLGLQCIKPSKKGDYSTDGQALDPYAYHPLVQSIIHYRNAAHFRGLFANKLKLLTMLDPLVEGGFVIHPGLNQSGTGTGRFSSSSPNMQQLLDPAKTKGKSTYNSRKPFGPRPGYVWAMFDYSGMETRLFTHFAQVPFFLDTIRKGLDPITEGAKLVWGREENRDAAISIARISLELDQEKPSSPEVAAVWEEQNWGFWKASSIANKLEKDTINICRKWLASFDWDIVAAEASINKKTTRTRFKSTMYAQIYGGGFMKLVPLLMCTPEQAKQTYDLVSKSVPEIKQHIRETEWEVRKNGYVMTAFDRKLRVEPDLAYRGVNYRIQGTGADMMKRSIIETYKFLNSTGLDAYVLMTVHDELIFEIKESDVSKSLLREIKGIMEEDEGRLTVPAVVDCQICETNWSEEHKYDLTPSTQKLRLKKK